VTLDSEGSAFGTAKASTSQATSTNHRNFTAKEPIPPNMA
jgi:hypothetical protein